MHNLKVRINTGTSSEGLHLTFVDDASGLVILKTRLSHEDLGKAVMGFTSMELFDAQVMEVRAAGWAGLQAHTFQRAFKCADLNILEMFRKGSTPPVLDLWAAVVKSRCWCQRGSWHVNNERRITFTMTRYENDLTEDKAAEIIDCLNSHDAPEGLI